jgi:hypothetical protein
MELLNPIRFRQMPRTELHALHRKMPTALAGCLKMLPNDASYQLGTMSLFASGRRGRRGRALGTSCSRRPGVPTSKCLKTPRPV